MRHATTARVSAALLALAGGAAPPVPEELPPALAGPEIAGSGEHQRTGSRIRNAKSNDRLVRAVGQQGYREAMDSQPRPLNAE